MAAIQGAHGLNNINTDEQPFGWAGITWVTEGGANPQNEATLAALMSLLPHVESESVKINWFEMAIPTREVFSRAAYSSSATSLDFSDAADGASNVAFNFRVGSLLKNTRTNEVHRITADPSANNVALTATRAFGQTAAASINLNDRYVILAAAEADNADSPTPISLNPTTKNNWIQLFSRPFAVGSLAMAEEMRSGPKYRTDRRLNFMQILRDCDAQLLHGEPLGSTSGNFSLNQTGGLVYGITTNVTDFTGTVSQSNLDTQLEKVFRYGTPTKIFMGGGVGLTTLNTLAQKNGLVNLLPDSETFGLRILQYVHPQGTLQFLRNPLMSISGKFNDWAFVLDTSIISTCYARGHEFQLKENVQSPATRGVKDEWLMSLGLKLENELAHAVYKTMTNWVAG